ncbi:MAG: accessory factor UbiK family protein [Gammaproteobacteria bacterium]
MFDPKMINDMAKQFADSLPPVFKDLNQEIEKNFRAFMQATFNRLDLVTREEFDIQTQVLAKTRSKVEALTEQLTAIEEKLKSHK